MQSYKEFLKIPNISAIIFIYATLFNIWRTWC